MLVVARYPRPAPAPPLLRPSFMALAVRVSCISMCARFTACLAMPDVDPPLQSVTGGRTGRLVCQLQLCDPGAS